MKEKDLTKRIGGLARAKALSDEQKTAIAKKGAIARWGYQVIGKGNFKKDFGLDIDCYVLDDPQKTAVISKRGMGQAIGFSRRGDQPPLSGPGEMLVHAGFL
jgi:hypothetical protein